MSFKKWYIQDKQKSYYLEKYKKDKQLKNEIDRRNNDIIFKIVHNLNNRIDEVFKKKGIQKSLQHRQYLDCRPEKLKIYLEGKFTEGMSYDNYGEWEVDHIIPISSFNLHDTEEAQKCFNYTNLQPLWKEDNMKKSNKLDFESHQT